MNKFIIPNTININFPFNFLFEQSENLTLPFHELLYFRLIILTAFIGGQSCIKKYADVVIPWNFHFHIELLRRQFS